MENHYATIANFNCTFKINGETYPMLEYFTDLIWPSFNNINIYRESKDKKTRFHISDVKIIELPDNNFALVGKHIKRTILEISPDFSIQKGFFGASEQKPSAPYATFIILLKNHRVIYFPNKVGAPDVRSFASTVRRIVYDNIELTRKAFIEELHENDYEFEGNNYKHVQDFTKKYLNIHYPYPEINIIPIESRELVSETFKNIETIKKVSFKFYKPNNEPTDFNNFFALSYQVLETTESKSINQTLNSPGNKDSIEDAISASSGKTNYTINARTIDNEPVTITPDKLTQKSIIEVNSEDNIELQSSQVYNQLKDKEVLKTVGEENLSIFTKVKDKLLSLI